MIEVMIPAAKVGLVIGNELYFYCCFHNSIIGKGGEMIKTLQVIVNTYFMYGAMLNFQESASCKMQMIQDGNFANAPEKPLRITGSNENVKVGCYSMCTY